MRDLEVLLQTFVNSAPSYKVMMKVKQMYMCLYLYILNTAIHTWRMMFLRILRFAPSNLPMSLEQDPVALEVSISQLFLLVRVHAGGRCAHEDGSAHIGDGTTHSHHK